MHALHAALGELRGYPLRVFGVCLLGWILTNMDQSFFGYAVPSIMVEFDVGLPVIGNILAIGFVLASVFIVLVGVLADRFGRRIMFVFCLATSAALVGAHGLVRNENDLLVLRCAAFALSSGLVPITNAFVVEAAPARLRGMMSGLLQCGFPLGWFIASLLAIPTITNWGWRYMFVPALLVVPLTFWLARLLPESQRFSNAVNREVQSHGRVQLSARERIGELFSARYRRCTWLGFVATFFFGGAYAGTAFYFPTFFQQVRGYSARDATFIVGLSYGIGVFGYIGASLVGEFLTTRRNTSVIWSWVGAITVLCVVWPAHSFVGDVVFFGIMAMFFFGNAAVLTTMLTEIFPTRVRATGVAVAAGVGMNLGFAIFPVLVAALIERIGWQWAFTISVVPSLVLSGLANLLQQNTRSGIDIDNIVSPSLRAQNL